MIYIAIGAQIFLNDGLVAVFHGFEGNALARLCADALNAHEASRSTDNAPKNVLAHPLETGYAEQRRRELFRAEGT